MDLFGSGEEQSSGTGPASVVRQNHGCGISVPNMAHISQSRPDSGPGLGHFQCEMLQTPFIVFFSGTFFSGTEPSLVARQNHGCGISVPLSSEYGTYKPDQARFWPGLEPFSVRKSLNPLHVFLLRNRTRLGRPPEPRLWCLGTAAERNWHI